MNDFQAENKALMHYPFGMLMPGRNFGSDGYRFGFSRHEKIDEVQGSGNVVDMGDRWLDVRIGRTPRLDAKSIEYPALSSYSYAANNPLIFIDPDGNEIVIAHRESPNSPIVSVVYNEDGTLTDRKTGELYTGNNEYILSVKTTLDNLSGTDDRTKLVVDDLVMATESHTIANYDFLYDKPGEETGSRNRTISSTPDRDTYTKFVPEIDRKNNPDFGDNEILAHELKHAYNYRNKIDNSGRTSNGIRLEEVDAVNFQNIVRQKEGKELRTKFIREIPDENLVKPEDYDNLKNDE